MTKKNLVITGLVLILALASGCKGGGEDVLAWVNNKKIDSADFEEKFSQMPPAFQQSEEQKRRFLDSLIDREILLAEARKRKLEKNANVKDRLQIALEQILIEELVQNAIPEVTVSEASLKALYEERKEQFIEPERVKVSQILVRSEDEAGGILQRLQKGEDFASLAREKSISPDAASGGDLNQYFGRGEMLPEFEKVAFDLKKGEISEVIKSPFGFHILKVTDKRDKRQKTFEEAREEIEAVLRQKEQREALDGWFKDLKEKAKIKVNEDYFVKEIPQAEVEE